MSASPGVNVENPEHDFEFDLDCPSCSATLTGDPSYEQFRVCPSCRRHFWISGRERLQMLVDAGSFAETNAALISTDPLVFRDPLPVPDRLAEARERTSLSDALITGVGNVAEMPVVLVVLDFAHFSGSIGIVAGEKITLAMELAASRKHPLVIICSGGPRSREGILSVVQLAKLANASARLHLAGVPIISLLTHPTTGDIFSALAAHADLIVGEPGARAGWDGVADADGDRSPLTPPTTTEHLLERGLIDTVVDRADLRPWLETTLSIMANRTAPRSETPSRLVPPSDDLTSLLFSEFIDLHGDRISADDPGTLTGLGRIEDRSVAVIAQQPWQRSDVTASGVNSAAGIRKAARIMRLAAHLDLPLIVLIDSGDQSAETTSQSSELAIAIGNLSGLLSLLPVPVVSVIVGEARGALSIALAAGDRRLMTAQAVFSLPGHEAVIGHDPELTPHRSLSARDCLRLGIVDAIVPASAERLDEDAGRSRQLATAILASLEEIGIATPRRLIDERSRRIRSLGMASPESREATRRELTELQELHRAISRSIGDLRERIENRQLSLPNLSGRPHLPSLNQLRKLNVNRAELEALAGRLAATGRGLVRGQKVTSDEPDAPDSEGDAA